MLRRAVSKEDWVSSGFLGMDGGERIETNLTATSLLAHENVPLRLRSSKLGVEVVGRRERRKSSRVVDHIRPKLAGTSYGQL